MVVVPEVRPLTTPEELIVATVVLVLLHTPPVVASVNVVEEPEHTVAVPLIVPAEEGLTVTTMVAATIPQVFVTVYDMVVVPAARPLTTPEVFTVATRVLVLLHTPPVVASVNVVDKPAITVAVPLIVPAAGEGLTVITWVATAVPQPFVTV